MKMEKRMKSSITDTMEEPLMMPSQPPILAENYNWSAFLIVKMQTVSKTPENFVQIGPSVQKIFSTDRHTRESPF